MREPPPYVDFSPPLSLTLTSHSYPPPDLSHTLIPFNYCMIAKLFPATQGILNLFCNHYD